MIISIVFLVLAALFAFLGVWKGKKFTWVYSAARIVGAVISAILAMLLAGLAARIVGGLIPSLIPGSIGAMLDELPTLALAMEALIAMLVAPILFWVFFPIVYPLLNILIPYVSKLLVKVIPSKVTGIGTLATEEESTEEESDEEEPPVKKKKLRHAELRVGGTNIAGMICGGVCGLLLFCIALVPLVGLMDTAHDVVGAVEAVVGEDKMPSALSDTLDDSVNNVGSVVIRTMGGRALYNGMTTYWAGEDTVHLSKELGVLAAVGDARSAYANTELSRADAAAAVREIETTLQEATLLPKLGAELLSAASDNWSAGEAYHGISMPSPAGYADLMKTIIGSQKNATTETFREDAGTLIHMVADLMEKDAMGKVRGNVMSLLGDKELTESLIYELCENPRLYVMIGGALDIGVDKIAQSLQMQPSRDELYDDFCDAIRAVERPSADSDEEQERAAKDYRRVLESYGLAVEDTVINAAGAASAEQGTDMVQWFATAGVVTAETMSEKSKLVTASELVIEPVIIQDKEKEAKNLAEALSVISAVSDAVASPDMDVADMVVDFGPAFDWLAQTETVGREKSAKIFKATLQSKKVSEQIGFSVLEASDIADTINVNAHRSSYAAQMLSLSQTVQVIRNSGTAGAESAIEALLADLTPESASTLQAISTPSVVMNHGVPERSAEPVSGMMSNMFGNLADAKEQNMSDEQLQRETAAVNKVMTMAMNAGSSNGSSFGEGSVTGTSAHQFVSDIMNSDVVSQTVMEQVYGDGNEPQNDPLASQRTMAADEEAELLAALNNQWTNATDAQRADETFQKKLISTAALMNVAVTITANGVEKVA